MCHPIWLCSRKYGTVWYHSASSKLWYLTTLSFVNFQGKLTGTSRDSLRVWSQLVRLAVCLALGARFASTGVSTSPAQSVLAAPHQVGGSMMIAGEPLRPQGFRRTLYKLIHSRITSQGWHNLALTQLEVKPSTKHIHKAYASLRMSN
jgi:hypothetical protein